MIRVFVTTISIIITICVFLITGSSAHPMWGIAVDGQGQVYFSDLKTIWKIGAQGNLSVFRAGDNSHTHDLNIDEAGNILGAENSYEPETRRFFSAVWKMTPAGSFSYLLAPTDDLPQGTSIWKDHDGNMYHVTYYPEGELLVLKRTPKGIVTMLAGSNNAVRNYRQGVPYSVGGLAFATDGTLYFTHGANVSKLTTSGTLIPLVRNLLVKNNSENPAGSSPLLGIAVDGQGNAFVADYGNRRVLKITSDGKNSTLIRAEESWFPTGIAVRGAELYILEYGHTPAHEPIGTRVRRLSSDGEISTLATVGENINPPARTIPVSTNIEPVAAPKVFVLYWLIGLCASIFAGSFVVWRLRKSKFI